MSSARRMRLAAVCLLVLGALSAAALASGLRATRPHRAAALAASAELPAASLLTTPVVPVSVTQSREITIAGEVQPGHAEQISLACYRLDSGVWVLERSYPASVTATDAGGRYSASVSLSPSGSWVVRAETTGTAEPSFSATSAEIRVSERTDATVWNRDGVLTIPERMAYRSDARQLIVVTAKSLKSRSGTLRMYEYRPSTGDWVKLFSSPCRLGRNGLCAGEVRRRGNEKTPTGIWRMPNFVFGQHSEKPAGTKLAYRHITKYHWWSAEKGSHYNTWVWSRRRVDGEHLINYRTTYEYAVSTGYNAKPNESVYGRGTGIFLHCWLAPGTAGCVSVSPSTMKRVFRTLDPAKRRVFAIGTTGAGDATSVFAY